jgi:D-alanyl-D-alanine carboxypeptidase (penicillin-binding protein 5/6)
MRSVPAWSGRLAALAAVAAVAALAAGPLAAAPAAAAPGPAISHAAAAATTGPAGIHATGADLEDATTGQSLWGLAGTTPRPMASITKIMTALVVVQDGNLARRIKVPQAAVSYVKKYGASSAGLRPGDALTARDLLEGLLLPSGCDAAYVLATAYGPGRTAFIAQMNAEAAKLGLASTHFANFDGLPWPTATATYSTPADLLTLARAMMAQPVLRAIVGQQRFHLAAASGHHAYTWRSTNLLLGSYPGAIGIKTGFTSAAGYCLLFEATRGTQTLVGVVLHSTATNPADRFSDAAAMLNWGFSQPPAPLRLASAPARRLAAGTKPGS